MAAATHADAFDRIHGAPMPTQEELVRQAEKPSRESLRLHPFYKGKIQVVPKCPVRGLDDFALWYTPGVAAPCKAIHADPAAAYLHTNKGNSVAIVTDGTRVLGLGDIGPVAALPVMEGKALLFKYLGGVDAVPICLDTKDPDEIVRIVRTLAPAFGGINLEDIAQPKCFGILAALRETMPIPVWHDDQQGTATVLLAGLSSALRIVGKDLRRIRIALVGTGAANISVYRLLVASGADPGAIVACDSKGTLHPGRRDIAGRKAEYAEKWRLCVDTNRDRIVGGIADALKGADVCIAFSQSGPGVIRPEWVKAMAQDAVVFACANPVPEIWPWEAKEAGARIVATGRSDFSNQVNNSLVFPGVFRGVLDSRARMITDGMAIAAAAELVRCAEDRGLGENAILPAMDDADVAAHVAAATGMRAHAEGVAPVAGTHEDLYATALAAIASARRATDVLMKEGVIPAPPG